MKAPEPGSPPVRQWSEAELRERWRHQKRLRSSLGTAAVLSVRAGHRHSRLAAAGPRSADLELDEATTAIRAFAEDPPSGDPILGPEGHMVALHLLWWDEEGKPRAPYSTRYKVGRGRSLVIHPPRVNEGRPSFVVRLELRDSLPRRLVSRSARWLAGSLRPDYCLSELRVADLRAWPVRRSLLRAFALIPAFVASVVALFLVLAGCSSADLAFGIAVGTLAAITGTVVCGASVSTAAAGLGGIPISIVLGVTNGVMVRSAGGVGPVGELLAGVAPVLAGLGGLAALVRPSALAVVLLASSIGALSLAMGGVRSLGETGIENGSNPKLLALAVLASGLGPGLIFGISALGAQVDLGDGAFRLGLALTGGVAFRTSVALRSGKRRIALLFGLGYAAWVLLSSGFQQWLAPGISSRLLVLAALDHVLLQGTFFSLAYVLGERASGPRGGVLASSIEGIIGYTGFLFVRYALL